MTDVQKIETPDSAPKPKELESVESISPQKHVSELQEPSVMRSNASCDSMQKSVFSELPATEIKPPVPKEKVKLPVEPQKVVCELVLRGGKYTGETVNKQPHGKGRMELANGSVYEGDFYWGAMHGKGDF